MIALVTTRRMLDAAGQTVTFGLDHISYRYGHRLASNAAQRLIPQENKEEVPAAAPPGFQLPGTPGN